MPTTFTEQEQALIQTLKTSTTLSQEHLATHASGGQSKLLELLESVYDYSQMGNGIKDESKKQRVLKALQNALRAAGISTDDHANAFVAKLTQARTFDPTHQPPESQENTPDQESTPDSSDQSQENSGDQAPTPDQENSGDQAGESESKPQTPPPSEQETQASATNIAHRQEILDKLKELGASAKSAEDLAYILKSFFELNTDRLERVAQAKATLLAKAKELASTATSARDLYLLGKYTQTLGENPPTTPAISFSHQELLKLASGELTISPSHSDTHGSNLTYELELTNLSAPKSKDLQAGTHTLTATNAARDTQATIKARAISPTGAASAWSEPITLTIKAAVFAGFIENIDTNKSKRINTGTQEDTLWLDKVQERLNERSNDDPVTKFFDRADMPHSHIKRYALKNDGSLELLPEDATLESDSMQKYLDNATYQCVSKIPDHYVIDVEFEFNAQSYLLKLTSLAPFSYDLNKAGYQGYTNLQGRGSDKAGIISSVKVDGFYLGSWESVSLGGMEGSFFVRSRPKPTNNQTREWFRSRTQSFTRGMKIQNHHEREAIALLYCIERGYMGSTADGKNTDQSKWSIHSWNTSAQNANSLYPAAHFGYGNKTISIPVSSSDKRAQAHIYRGICNLAGNVWEFLDGCFLNDKLLYLATHEQDYSDTTSPTTYTNTGKVVNITSGQQVKRVFAGTMVPKSTDGGTSTNGTTDGGWIADGVRLLIHGGSLCHSARAGVLCWFGSNAFSHAYWSVGSRPCFKDPT